MSENKLEIAVSKVLKQNSDILEMVQHISDAIKQYPEFKKAVNNDVINARVLLEELGYDDANGKVTKAVKYYIENYR